MALTGGLFIMDKYVFKKDIECAYDTDVLVCGAGPAGFAAAISAAREGKSVILAEKNAFCGGMATAGLVAPFMTCYDSSGERQLIAGIFEELVQRLVKCGGALYHKDIPAWQSFTSYIGPGHIHVTPFDAEDLKRVCDEMLIEAGVRVLYHTEFVSAELSDDGKQIDHVVLSQKSRLVAAKAKIVIDCTGDGDVAASAGEEYVNGNGKSMQPASMFFRIGNVDLAKVDADIEANRDNFYRKDGINYRSFHWRVAEAKAAGDWTLDRVSIGMFRGVREDEWSINTSRVMNIDGTDSESLTRGEIEGRAQVKEIYEFLKKYVPGCENAKLLSSGSTLGIRETRHIKGMKTLTVDALLNGEVPNDSIMIAANSVDVHGKFGPKSNEYITLKEGTYYGVPYGCLVPFKTDNLLVAGRCISATSDAAGAIRVMPPCFALGEAAGKAASCAIDADVSVKNVDVEVLRKLLTDGGALL